MNTCGWEYFWDDYAQYCWYKGCKASTFAKRLARQWLYMLLAINNAAIVWYEGIPEDFVTADQRTQWVNISLETGVTFAQIFVDFTGFYPQPRDLKKDNDPFNIKV